MGVEELMRILTQPRWVSNPLGMCWYVVQTLGEGTNFASQQATPTTSSRIFWNTLTFWGCAPSQDAIARWKSGSQPCSHPVMMFLHCWRDGAYRHICVYNVYIELNVLALRLQSLMLYRGIYHWNHQPPGVNWALLPWSLWTGPPPSESAGGAWEGQTIGNECVNKQNGGTSYHQQNWKHNQPKDEYMNTKEWGFCSEVTKYWILNFEL